MPQYYSILDNGQTAPKSNSKGRQKQRAAVRRYLEKQGITASPKGQRSEAEKQARLVGRSKYEQRKTVRQYVKSKGGKLSPAGERGKREMRLRAEGRAIYASAGQVPKKKKVKVTSGSRMAPKR